MKDYKTLINGEMIYGEQKIIINSPLNGEIVGSVPQLDEETIDYAFDSARKSFYSWSKLNYETRIEYILKFSKILKENINLLAFTMVMEICKSYSECVKEIERTIIYIDETIKSYKDCFVKMEVVGEDITDITGKTGFFQRVPLGVILAISPFNYPINLSLSKIIPGLILGNTIVFKPSTQGSISAVYLASFFQKARFPAGIINVITGKGAEIGDYLIQNKNIDMISFTGGPEIGNKIRTLRGDCLSVLELGGNDPAIIESDANLDLSVKEIIKGAFNYSGQRCTAIKVVYADEIIKNEVIKKLIDNIRQLSIGSPYDNVDIVPLISNKSAKFALELIEDAKLKKGKVLIGGQSDGNLIFPTLIEMKTLNAKIMQCEQFAPILPIYFYNRKKIKNIVDNINKSRYGLQASIFTNSKDNFWNIGNDILAGRINWNRSSSRGPDIFPFLGIKDSGQGVQGIYYALESMSRIKVFVENK
ncbi:MAG: aldehyde dehydrogenase family protein [Mycoplasmoidaceae bacterium]